MSTVSATSLPGAYERGLLRDELRAFLQAHVKRGGQASGQPEPESGNELWQGLTSLGLSTLGSQPEEGGVRELVVVMEELGRAAVQVPMLGAALVNCALRGHSGQAALALLDRLHQGTTRVAVSFGELDPEPQAAELDVVDGRISGVLRFVDAAEQADELVLMTPDGLLLLGLRSACACVVPTPALGMSGWCEIELREATSELLTLPDDRLTGLRDMARLLLLARAHGAARRAFELAVDYARERQQFGQPIGRFQAIQHKLADNAIWLEGVRLTLEHAAESLDFERPDASYYIEAAVAFGAHALRQASLETQHTFGAIGYAEEHEAPRHFRRAHLDVMALGGGRAARRALASWLLDKPDGRVPEYDLGPPGNAFREEVRQWLARHWSGERKREFDARPFHDREFDTSFARDLGQTGWLGMGWPKAFGGQERTPLEQLGFMEVMERAEAPRIGASVQANALIMFGTPEQQQRYLPEILRGEVMHGMGYSEPNSGSDLASLRTSAVLDGDQWVINGQKIWTTTWWGQYMFLAARTDRNAQPQHAGISMFIVPMDTPGITIHSARTMYDGSFANIFYDNVRIPKENIVGPVNGGWKVLTGALANERGSVGGGIVLKVVHGFEALCDRLRDSPHQRDDAWVRDAIGALAADIEVGRRLMIHCAELAASGETPPAMGAMSKVFSGELMERYGECALELLGPRAALSQYSAGAIQAGRFEQQLRHSLMWVISIGTNEIQRSLIAQRGLGLPR